MNKICDECETVAHCTKHGCIPKVSVNEAMKLALEALQEVYWSSRSAKHDEAITALREALTEQPAQRKPLPEDQLLGIWNKAITQDNGRGSHLSNQPFVHIARAFEAAHGIKENT